MAKLVGNDLNFNNTSRAINLPDPTAAQHAATKNYVDSAVQGINWKESARVSAPANINLASPGATIDGVTMATGDRVLLANQTTASQNGVYVWNGAAAAMTRSADANSADNMEQLTITVEEGTSAGSTYRQTAIIATLETTAVAFSSFGTSAPAASTSTAGIAALATQAEVDAGTVTNKIVTPQTLKSTVLRLQKYTTTVGDGSATSYTVTHNLATKDVLVNVYYTGGTFDEVFCDVLHATTNTITLVFATAPSTNQFSVVVIG